MNAEHGLPPHAVSDEIKEAGRKLILEEGKRLKEIVSYFGREHMVPQKSFFLSVPVTPVLVSKILGSPLEIDKPTEIWTIVRIQKKVSELTDANRLMLLAGYAECGPTTIDEEAYWRTTDHLIAGQTPEQPISQEDFLHTQCNPHLRKLVEEAAWDETLRKALGDCVGKAIRYANTTGDILDLAGNDNLIFFKKEDGVWSYLLLIFANQIN